MPVNYLQQELIGAIEKLKMAVYLLDRCNHSHHHGEGYAHHVRDRISESLVNDIGDAIEKIRYVSDRIGQQNPNDRSSDPKDAESDAVPF